MAGSGIESRNSVEHRLPDYEPSRISWCNLVDKLPSVFIMNIEIKLEMLLPMYSKRSVHRFHTHIKDKIFISSGITENL